VACEYGRRGDLAGDEQEEIASEEALVVREIRRWTAGGFQ